MIKTQFLLFSDVVLTKKVWGRTKK